MKSLSGLDWIGLDCTCGNQNDLEEKVLQMSLMAWISSM